MSKYQCCDVVKLCTIFFFQLWKTTQSLKLFISSQSNEHSLCCDYAKLHITAHTNSWHYNMWNLIFEEANCALLISSVNFNVFFWQNVDLLITIDEVNLFLHVQFISDIIGDFEESLDHVLCKKETKCRDVMYTFSSLRFLTTPASEIVVILDISFLG